MLVHRSRQPLGISGVNRQTAGIPRQLIRVPSLVVCCRRDPSRSRAPQTDSTNHNHLVGQADEVRFDLARRLSVEILTGFRKPFDRRAAEPRTERPASAGVDSRGRGVGGLEGIRSDRQE